MQSTTSEVAGITTDALTLLENDHGEVERLFERCEQQPEGSSGRRDLARTICRELKIHTQIEEEVFYPALREAGVDAALLDDAEREHAEAKQLVAQIEGTGRGGDADTITEPLARLMQAVRNHVREEEDVLFPAARDRFMDLGALGRKLAERKWQLGQQMKS